MQQLDCVAEMAPIDEEDVDAERRARLADSLSASYPSQALSKAFQMMPEDDSDSENDPLASSCFAELRLERVKMEDLVDSDDELTSLTWLQETNLLRNIRVDNGTSPMGEEGKPDNDDTSLQDSGIYGIPHPPHVPYNPQKHVNSKPPYSFSCLIFMAIEDSPDKKLPVKDIYSWIHTHFPYFQNAPTGWKNSIRHNLSLNKCFKKVEKDRCSNIGKGSLWMIDPDFRPNLLQALRKTPYHPYHQLQMFSNNPNTTSYGIIPGSEHKPLQPKYNVNTPSPHLFPFLSRRLAQSDYDNNTSVSSVSVSDIDVANTLVSLKRAAENRVLQHDSPISRSPSPPEFGSEREKELLRQKKMRSSRSDSPIVCYAIPSEDHSYCIAEDMIQQSEPSPKSSIDEEYEFGNNDSSISEDEAIFSESDYDEEGWSEEEELYNNEKMKRSGYKYNNRRSTVVIKTHKPHYKTVSAIHHSSRTSKVVRKTAVENDEDEGMKLAEGANALLNLAGIKTAHIVPLRSISPNNNNNCNNNNDSNMKNIGLLENNLQTDCEMNATPPSFEIGPSGVPPLVEITSPIAQDEEGEEHMET